MFCFIFSLMGPGQVSKLDLDNYFGFGKKDWIRQDLTKRTEYDRIRPQPWLEIQLCPAIEWFQIVPRSAIFIQLMQLESLNVWWCTPEQGYPLVPIYQTIGVPTGSGPYLIRYSAWRRLTYLFTIKGISVSCFENMKNPIIQSKIWRYLIFLRKGLDAITIV